MTTSHNTRRAMIPDRAVYAVFKGNNEDAFSISIEKIDKELVVLLTKRRPRPSCFRITFAELLQLLTQKDQIEQTIALISQQDYPVTEHDNNNTNENQPENPTFY